MDTLLQDLRYAARQLSRNPGFTLVAVLTLALGIGASSAIFSVVNGVLLRSLPFEEPERLVRVYTSESTNAGQHSVSSPNFMSLREQRHIFEDVAVFDMEAQTLTGRGDARELDGAQVSAGFFEVLRARPMLGRTFRAEENQPGNDRVVVLGHGAWQQLFGGDPAVLGKTLTLEGIQRTVVGIMPPGFGYPEDRSLWIPLEFGESFSAQTAQGRGGHWLHGVGRLRRGITHEQAQAELRAVAQRLEQEFPEGNRGVSFALVGLHADLVGEARTPLLVLLGAVGVVLLIACANVAGLLLARSTSRRGEIAIRAALGAGRGRLTRQLLTESLFLSILGGSLGLLVAVWSTQALMAARPEGIPRLDDVRVDLTVLAFTLGASLLTVVLAGLVPAIQATRGALAGSVREGGRGGLAERGGNRVRSGLVVAEMALAVVLLAGAGLLVRSFVRLISVDPGFRTERVVTFPVELPETSYESDPAIQAFYESLTERIGGLPGVESAAAVFRLPLASPGRTSSLQIEGRPPARPGEEQSMEIRTATPAYFGAMRMPIRRGRGIEAGDREGSRRVAVINEAAARRYFPGEDPVGKQIRFGWSRIADTREIVGVVGDVRHYGLARDPEPEVYFPHAQVPMAKMVVVVRTATDPLALSAAIRREVHALDPNIPVTELRTLEQVVSASVSRPRFTTTLLALFAAVALTLAAIGIFGLLSFTIVQRTREIGLRIALGARPRQVLAMVLRRALTLVGIGLGLGIMGALVLTRLLESVLYDVSPTDPTTFAAVALLLTVVSLLASYMPARRATRVDPMIALRSE